MSTPLAGRVTELEAAIAARDRFIAAVGHELRNVMAPLVLIADAMKEASVGGPDRRMLMLARNLDLLKRTVDRVTEVAHLREEKLTLEPEEVEMGALVREVIEEHKAVADAATMKLSLDAEKPVSGKWDPRRLRQIVSNLIANAIRHSGSPTVEITVRGDEQSMELRVADRGRGIEASRRARLFDAFDMIEPKRNGGLGVGLWIVHTLCKHFRGSISLADDHNPGCCFRVVLPRV